MRSFRMFNVCQFRRTGRGIKRGNAHENINDPGKDRNLAEDDVDQVDLEEPDQSPVQPADDDKDQANDVQNVHSLFHAVSPGRFPEV